MEVTAKIPAIERCVKDHFARMDHSVWHLLTEDEPDGTVDEFTIDCGDFILIATLNVSATFTTEEGGSDEYGRCEVFATRSNETVDVDSVCLMSEKHSPTLEICDKDLGISCFYRICRIIEQEALKYTSYD